MPEFSDADLTPLDNALSIIKRGWAPLPVLFRSKRAICDDWPNLVIDELTAPNYFDGAPMNMGVNLGASKGLTDVDLDCPEAIAFAPYLLPDTRAIFGRASKQSSHWLYYTDLVTTADTAVLSFKGPDKDMLVELRTGAKGKGAQTVFPGSVHESGERIEWVKNGEPAKVDGDRLRECVIAIAVGSLLVRHWPGKGSRHDAASVLGGFLARAGLPELAIAKFVAAVAKVAKDEQFNERGGTAKDAAQAYAKGKNTYGKTAMRDMFGDAVTEKISEWLAYDDQRTPAPAPINNVSSGAAPFIKCVPGELPRMADEAQRALLNGGMPVYARGGKLVRPITDDVPASDGRVTKVAKLRDFGRETLVEALSTVATFKEYNNKRKQWVTKDPPAQVAQLLLEREGFWPFPKIAGVITAPTLRPDGSLLSAPGYDPATRLYLVPNDTLHMPDIPEHPTREHGAAALGFLAELLGAVPFVAPVDRAVALAGILTAVVRGALDTAPMHGVSANTPGTGKSYLIDLISVIATGRHCPVIAAGQTDEETEKRLGALLLEGVPIVSIDNVSAPLGGDFLCQITERPFVRTRILGRSEAPEFECRASVFATGNNLTFLGDMTRRAILCRLDAAMERPEQRQFKFNPIEKVLQDRGMYVAAAIIVARAYQTAGAPPVCGAVGSYERWSRLVRAPLIWLGEVDPISSMESIRAADPEVSTLREVMSHWQEHLGLGHYTANAAITHACEKSPDDRFLRDDFRDVLLRIAGDRGVVSSKRFGRWLTKMAGRPVGGSRFVMDLDAKHGNRFALVRSAT